MPTFAGDVTATPPARAPGRHDERRTSAPLLESARAALQPPSAVHHVQDAVRWLSSAIVKLDQGSPEASAAIADALARLLVDVAFTQVAER